MSKEKDPYRLSRLLPRVLPLVRLAPAGWLAAWVPICVVHGISWTMKIWGTQAFFDSVVKAVSGQGSLQTAIGWLALLFGIIIVGQVFNGLDNFVSEQFSERIRGEQRRRVFIKAGRIDPVQFESPAFLDTVEKAREGGENAVSMLLLLLALVGFYLVYFVSAAVYLFQQRPILILALVLVFLPVLLTQYIRTSIYAKAEDAVAPLRRQVQTYEKYLVDRAFFKETRLLGGHRFFSRLFVDTLRLLSREQWRANRKATCLDLLMQCITLAGYGGILYLLVTSLLDGFITIGAFAAVFDSIGTLFGIATEIVSRRIGRMAEELGTTKNFFRFMDAPERGGEDIAVDSKSGISVRDVSFRYPGAEQDAVRGVSLDIAPKETLAIVGENGAGKTTLVRLLTGLFLPGEGTVEIGGIDTQRVAMPSLYQGISAVFQKYQRYRMTLRENIAISDMSRPPDDTAIGECAEKGGLDMDAQSFPQGPDTMLSREFDGVDLSGGQWQRVAIARGFYRAHNLIVLDEPTAAIDPLEETRVYRKFSQLSQDCTAVIVTHRMGSARIADRIVVMADGKIDDIGTHDELMARDGQYAAMVRAQADWYR